MISRMETFKKKGLDHFSALYVGQTGNFIFRFHFNQIDDIWTTPILWAKKAFDLIEQNSPPWSNINEVFNSSSRFMEQVPKTLNERANFFFFLINVWMLFENISTLTWSQQQRKKFQLILRRHHKNSWKRRARAS